MAGSAVDAVGHAVERSKQLLFNPLKGEKWFALGFTVFLAHCGEGGGASLPTNFNFPSASTPSTSGSGGPDFKKMLDDGLRVLHADVAYYVGFAIGATLALFAIWLLVLWLSSRAKLMFVESVIWDRVDVGAQWSRASELGMSLFKFRAVLVVGGALLILATFGAGVAVGFPDFIANRFTGPQALTAYAIVAFAAVGLGFPLSIVALITEDFVAPLMVIRNARVGEAWRLCRAEVLSANVGGVMFFYVLKMALGVAIMMATLLLTCVTCCLTALPYLGTVLLLPVFVFSRAYGLYYLEQLGIQVFPAPEPSWAIYEQWRFPR